MALTPAQTAELDQAHAEGQAGDGHRELWASCPECEERRIADELDDDQRHVRLADRA